MHWTDPSRICVPFGNANYDSGLGGSHDMDYALPPNTSIDNIVEGIISDISSPSWGMQVCLELKQEVEGHKYFAYLHLAAVNPTLRVGDDIVVGTAIGWSGGCTNSAQYEGTSNPTKTNFTNSSQMSSQPQIGIALCDGPSYGGVGWKTFPPIDTTLDPMPIVDTFRSTMLPIVDLKLNQFNIEFCAVVPKLSTTTGIAKRAYSDYLEGKDRGPALCKEYTFTNWNGDVVTVQSFGTGMYQYNPANGNINWFGYHTEN